MLEIKDQILKLAELFLNAIGYKPGIFGAFGGFIKIFLGIFIALLLIGIIFGTLKFFVQGSIL